MLSNWLLFDHDFPQYCFYKILFKWFVELGDQRCRSMGICKAIAMECRHDFSRVWDASELLEIRLRLTVGFSAIKLLKGVELPKAISFKLSKETTGYACNAGGEVAPTPLVKKLVASE
jgi:hypothetical protein